jgi:hypothetical protein
MRRTLFLTALVALALARAEARADDPVTVDLRDRATVGTALVLVGDVATVSGGDEAARGRVARIDLAELKTRDPGTTIGRRSVEYRLLLAGVDARVTGADRATVTQSRRPLTADEVTAAARAELFRHYADSVAVELTLPVAVKLPDVPATERVVITGRPRGTPGALGRVQMDMTIAVGSENLLALAVHFDVQAARLGPAGFPAAAGPRGAAPPAGAAPAAAADVVIQPRQRVQIQVVKGPLKVTALGEAQQGGRLGQTILVQNVDSKKVVSGRISGPGTVDVDLGGAP